MNVGRVDVGRVGGCMLCGCDIEEREHVCHWLSSGSFEKVIYYNRYSER